MGDRTVLEQAASWMLQLQDPHANSETFLEWQRWLAAAPENRTAYEQVERTMSILADLESPPLLPSAAEMADDTYDGSVSVSEYLERSRSGVRSDPCDSGANHGHLPRPLAWLATAGARRVTVRCVMVSCAAAVLVVTGWVGATFLERSKAWQGELAYATAPAQRQSVLLPDGSRVTLGADSAIGVELRSDRRMLRLTRGEAYFQVAKDAKRPFVVSAGEARVRAVGTEFNVRLGARRTVVAVAEGVVRVSAPSYLAETSNGTSGTGAERHLQESSILVMAQLGAGQAVAYEDESGLQALPAGDASLAVTWLGGRRQYRNEPLRYVLADVNRYTGRRVEVANDATGALKFTGTLSVESSDAWFKALAIALPVTILQQADGKLLVALKESDSGAASQKSPDTLTGVDVPHP